MVTIEKTEAVVDSGIVSGLSSIGVEVLNENGLVGTFLAREVKGGKTGITVCVKRNGKKCVEDVTATASEIHEAVCDSGAKADGKVFIRIENDEKNAASSITCEPSEVWGNAERDEVTFTVRIKGDEL